MNTILLTGATGFLGSYLLESFVLQKFEVLILKRSTSNTWRIDHLLSQVKSYNIDKVILGTVFEENKVDVIVHTACSYGRNGESIVDLVQTNLMYGLNLLKEGIKNNVKTFINTDSLLPKDVNDYSLSKVQFSEWLLRFSNQIQVINMKIEHMYGPKDDNKKFFPWLINEMINTNNDINLTSGIQKRDFIYISDVVTAYDLVLKQRNCLPNWSQFDVGTNHFVQVKEFVLTVANEIEKIENIEIISRLRFGAIDYRDGDCMEPYLDNSLLINLGWSPRNSIKKGLKKCVVQYIRE